MTNPYARRAVTPLASIAVALLLVSCAPGSPSPQPTPTTTGVDGGVSGGADHGWLLTATTSYLTASTRVCSWQTVLPTDPADDAFGWNGNGPEAVFEFGGYPDSWTPDQQYSLSNQGIIVFDFSDGTWEGSLYQGEAGTVGYTAWQTFGDFSPQLDASGRLIGATGTGDTFHSVTPDVAENSDETLTLTVEPAPDAPWCPALKAANGR